MATKKRKPGRPIKGKQRVKRYNVVMEPSDAEFFRALGHGNLSGGLAAAKIFAETHLAIDPRRLRGAVFTNRLGDPIGDAALDRVQDDDTLRRWVEKQRGRQS